MRMRPWVGSSSPATSRSVVVFPHPDGPSSAKNDPAGIVRSSSSIAVNPGKVLRIPSSCRSAPDSPKPVPAISGAQSHGLELGTVLLLLLVGQRAEDVRLGERLLVREDQLVVDLAGVELLHGLAGTDDGRDVVHPRGDLGGDLGLVVVVDQLLRVRLLGRP